MSDTAALILFFVVSPVLFIGMWLFILKLLASMGGWGSLALSYGTDNPVDGESFSYRSGRLGVVNYNHCLHFTAGRSGLGIAVVSPFRANHRPLLIPWRDVSAADHRVWFLRYVDLRFAAQPQVRLIVSRRLAEELIAAGGHAVRIRETG